MESMVSMKLFDFYKGKNVFVTGHTGFKGSWLCCILIRAGAHVTGYALDPLTNLSLFDIADIAHDMRSLSGDIRHVTGLQNALVAANPDIVFHLAAQPLVRESYQNPHATYETNVMGTVNILESIRQSDRVKSFLNVTTDKVYENKEWAWGYRENETINGYDPYSNSKSCSELVTQCYKNAFFSDGRVAISTARAGNVIGGGDFAKDRIIPDCIRAAMEGRGILVRNPFSTRPYQHVLEPLHAYLLIAARQFEDGTLADSYNVGPDEEGCYQTGELVNLFCDIWGNGQNWTDQSDHGPHEANFLKLDCSKIKTTLGWKPRWCVEKAVEKTVTWTKCWLNGSAKDCLDDQIQDFFTPDLCQK